jgi:hypothetical protein
MEATQRLAVDGGAITNGARALIEQSLPYRMTVTVIGVAPLLFHAWNTESVKEKGAAAKGSRTKKTDDLESYVYRDRDGNLGVPGQNFVSALALAGKRMPDPSSPRKSAFDLCKAGIIPLSIVAPFLPGRPTWDFEDARRVTIQRAGITRIRPAMREGWQLSFDLLITMPDYLPPQTVMRLVGDAGRLVGLCDYRPTFGRFSTVSMVCHED